MTKLFVLLFALAASVAPLLGQHRPQVTESVQTVPTGRMRLEAGLEFLRQVRIPLSGLQGDLIRAGVLTLRAGVGERVELLLSGSVQNSLQISERFEGPNSPKLQISEDRTNDFGDLTTATKIRIRSDSDKIPGIGWRFGVTLPNASNAKGIGTDEMSFFSALILEKRIGPTTVLGNLGLLILGDPVDAGAQDDLLSYGLALLLPVRNETSFLADFHGRAGPGGVGNEVHSRLILGARTAARGLNWDAGLMLGFRAVDPDWGIGFGISKEFPSPF